MLSNFLLLAAISLRKSNISSTTTWFQTILIILFFECLSGLISFAFLKRKSLGLYKFSSSQRIDNSNINDIQSDKYYQKLIEKETVNGNADENVKR